MAINSDRDILATVRTDKTTGIHLLFDRYYRPLVLFANEYTGNMEDARDVVQSLFLRLWEDDYLIRLTTDGLGSYLFSAVRNACKSRLSKRDVLANPAILQDNDIAADWITDIDEELIESALRAVDQLPLRTREAVELVILKGRKYKDAASLMGISVNTVKYLLKEGLKRIRG